MTNAELIAQGRRLVAMATYWRLRCGAAKDAGDRRGFRVAAMAHKMTNAALLAAADEYWSRVPRLGLLRRQAP